MCMVIVIMLQNQGNGSTSIMPCILSVKRFTLCQVPRGTSMQPRGFSRKLSKLHTVQSSVLLGWIGIRLIPQQWMNGSFIIRVQNHLHSPSRNTRYGWMAKPCPIVTYTLKEAPRCAWSTNA